MAANIPYETMQANTNNHIKYSIGGDALGEAVGTKKTTITSSVNDLHKQIEDLQNYIKDVLVVRLEPIIERKTDQVEPLPKNLDQPGLLGALIVINREVSDTRELLQMIVNSLQL